MKKKYSTLKLRDLSKLTSNSIENICKSAKQIGISLSPYPDNILEYDEVLNILGELGIKDIEKIKEKLFRPNVDKTIYYSQANDSISCLAIGKLMFFDYAKNKFGLISEIKCEKDIQAEKVHVSESGLSTDKRLYNGELVTLILNKSPKGIFATNVKPFSEINLKAITNFAELIGIKELEKAIYNSVRDDYQNIDSEDRVFINKIIQKVNGVDAWELLVKIGADEQEIENYISTHIDPLTDDEKIFFLKKTFTSSLLNNILINWSTYDKKSLLCLTDSIRNKELASEQISNSFINIVSELEWTFEQIWYVYSVFKVSEIAQKVINLFSFKIYNYADKLKSLVPLNSLDNTTIKKLKFNLNSEKESISASLIIDIYAELKDYQLIKDENELMVFLTDKILKDAEIKYLISFLTNSCQINLFRQIISNSIGNISSWQIIELLELCEHKYELSKVFIDEYFSHKDENSKSDNSRIITFLKEKNYKELSLHFTDKFHKQLSLQFPFEILEIAVISNHINAQKIAYQNLTFKTESEIVDFIDKFSNYCITDEVKASNKPLSAFLNFFNSKAVFNLTEDCKQFLQINKGIAQCLLIKFLIFQLYKQKISRTRLVEILNSCQWTEISALLIKAFVQESNYTEKILLDKLNEIFKTHFEVLSSQSFEQKSFLDNFTIRNILNKCNGRKYYNIEHWEKNGVSRWYVKGAVTICKKESLNCYCEGRPWKKEFFWDSQSNKPSAEQYEFYWCKTSYCAERNDLLNLNRPFRDWTFSEIAAALNIKIEKIAIATLAGWANRMNQIVEHLFCRTCKEVLRPLPFRPSTLGYYAVPLFHCINDKCPDKQIIRFTHCLNGKCESHKKSEPLDSRDCESCRPNDPKHSGLKCNYCGSSCPACSGYNNRIVANEVW